MESRPRSSGLRRDLRLGRSCVLWEQLVSDTDTRGHTLARPAVDVRLERQGLSSGLRAGSGERAGEETAGVSGSPHRRRPRGRRHKPEARPGLRSGSARSAAEDVWSVHFTATSSF